jgi:DNA-binding LytR/AlgR family response regulator
VNQAAIIEDEKPAARRLQRLLEKRGIAVQKLIHSVAEGVDWFSNNPAPELLLVDIQLSDGLFFDIFKKVSVNSALIFTTAYDEYALQAFKLNSIHYLLKPINEADLDAALEKFQKHFRPELHTHIDFEGIKSLVLKQSGQTFKNRLTVKVGQQLKLINMAEVVCIYSSEKATFVRTQQGRDYLLDETMDIWENRLNPQEYFRVNRQFIISAAFIDKIVNFSHTRLKVLLLNAPDFDIVVSRNRIKDFRSWIG